MFTLNGRTGLCINVFVFLCSKHPNLCIALYCRHVATTRNGQIMPTMFLSQDVATDRYLETQFLGGMSRTGS
jgi:hypothetical protein